MSGAGDVKTAAGSVLFAAVTFGLSASAQTATTDSARDT